jgi:hypothetical protein
MRYYAIKDTVTEAVLHLERSLLDFLDFGTRVPAPGGVWAWGWIETDRPITPELQGLLGLVPAERR